MGKGGEGQGRNMHDIQGDEGYGKMINLMVQVEKEFKPTLL